ncbi:MAG: RNA polymerase sigma factor [Bacillota bacterium]
MQSDTSRREAFATLYSQWAPRLYRTALGILGNPHDASDALQEAGLKAYRYFDSLHDADAGAAWLTRILINACYDVGRKRSRTVPAGLEVASGVAPMEGGVAGDWETMQALKFLPEEQRTTVVLRFFQDLTIPQIATVMGVPEGTVKSRLHAALSKLRHQFSEAGKEGAQ